MAKSKLPDLVKKFESGEIDYDKLVEIDVEADDAEYQTVRVPKNLVDKVLAMIAREAKTKRPKAA